MSEEGWVNWNLIKALARHASGAFVLYPLAWLAHALIEGTLPQGLLQDFVLFCDQMVVLVVTVLLLHDVTVELFNNRARPK